MKLNPYCPSVPIAILVTDGTPRVPKKKANMSIYMQAQLPVARLWRHNQALRFHVSHNDQSIINSSGGL